MKINRIAFLLVVIVLFLTACSDQVVVETSPPLQVEDKVTIQESTVDWETYQYELTDSYTIKPGSYDGVTKVNKTFNTWVMENKYLKVTLLPEFGGRILSIFYKPTGHEELYQNPVGVPYQIDTNVFYFNWLMVYGGIFPTFPEPEHGKAWFLPWDFEIITNTDQEVTVAMSFTDDLESPLSPAQYNVGITGLKLTYYVTLKAGRAAVDTVVVLENPGDKSVIYEYWTNTTLAPGSDPLDPKTTAGAEIIAPVDTIKIPSYWTGIIAQEKPAGLTDVYTFDALRYFENWADMGIAYAFPDISESNFWGVINHDNQEGIFRIADNSITPGLKVWTWGYEQSLAVDPYASANETRPYIELWAGVTKEFWQRTTFPANYSFEIKETYSPSVGLTNVTHANENFLINLVIGSGDQIECQIFGIYPDQTVEMTLFFDDTQFFETSITLDPLNGNSFTTNIPDDLSGESIRLVITSQKGDTLFEGTIEIP